jgi:hypothetical protein
MALTETKVIDKIEVVESGTLQLREATRIMRDGVQLTQTYHRTSLTPGQDLTGQPANVVAIAQAAWTPEVISAYEDSQAEAAQRMGA